MLSATISTWPVASFLFCSTRSCTGPETDTTHSDLNCSARECASGNLSGEVTTWTIPERSRISKKRRPPIFLHRWTQPHTEIVCFSWAGAEAQGTREPTTSFKARAMALGLMALKLSSFLFRVASLLFSSLLFSSLLFAGSVRRRRASPPCRLSARLRLFFFFLSKREKKREKTEKSEREKGRKKKDVILSIKYNKKS